MKHVDENQKPLSLSGEAPIHFDGETYEPEHDLVRLTGQMADVFDFMKDGIWRTLGRISSVTNHPEASVSARLRDMRKSRFGQHIVNRRRSDICAGLFEYQLIVNKENVK